MIDLIHSGTIAGEHNGLRVIECTQCGFKHLHPLPDAVEVRARYVQYIVKKINQSFAMLKIVFILVVDTIEYFARLF